MESGTVQGPSLLLKVDEAASLLGVGRTKLYELIATGGLPVVRIGRAVRVSRRALEEYAEQLEAEQRV